MNESHAVSALRKKRAELSGELIEVEKQRRALANKVNHVDEALKLNGFEGDPRDIPARRKRGWIFRRSQLQQMVFSAMRDAASPHRHKTGKFGSTLVQTSGQDHKGIITEKFQL